MGEIYRESRTERKQREAYDGLVAAVGIRNGVQCKNWVVDQQKVAALLARIAPARGGTTGTRVGRDGYCDPSLHQGILNFQRANAMAIVDGVVDPGGATFKLLQTLSSGVLPAPAPGEEKELEFFDNVDVLIRLLEQLLSRYPLALGPARTARLHQIKSELQGMLARITLPPRPKKPLPTQAGGVGVLFVIGLILVVTGILLLLVTVIPSWRKAAKEMADGIIRLVHEAEREMMLFTIGLFGTVASAVVDIQEKARSLVTNKCRDDYQEFERRTTKVVSELYKQKPLISVAQDALKAWIASLMKLLECMGPAGHLLLLMLRALTEGGGSVMDLIKKILGENWQPPPLMMR